MENILPENVREREDIAASMPKTVRINTNLTTRAKVFSNFRDLGYIAIAEPLSRLPRHHLE